MLACIVAGIYELALYGLVLAYDSRLRPVRSDKFLYGFLGAMLIFIAWVWLEILINVIPFLSAY